jgi:hexosaminidase
MTYNLTKTEAKSVLGGEVALWSEQSDSAVVDMKIWPRAAAAAEAMWSGRYDSTGLQRDIGEAQPRIFDWRYRLIERGIGAEPIQPLWW